MSRPINFAALTHDAEIEARLIRGEYVLSASEYQDGVVALARTVELVKLYLEPLPYRREIEDAKERGDKLRAALARFDFEGTPCRRVVPQSAGHMIDAPAEFCRFLTEPSQPGDGPPEWPKGADYRIVGIACPQCGNESRRPEHRNGASFGETVRCTKCGWSGRVPL
jgi:predicted RNA-binding Zn-ribbon protein involved in translation (DUF1610 family)